MSSAVPAKADPWRGVSCGDRFYWTGTGVEPLCYEVTDLWFDPVRGEKEERRGYMAAVRLVCRAGKNGTLIGNKRPMPIGKLLGKHYTRAEKAIAAVEAFFAKSFSERIAQ